MNCTVCCNPIRDFAFGPCNHKDLCANCMLHWILLYKEHTCPTCREEMTSIVITTNPKESYLSVMNSPMSIYDKRLNAYFNSKELAESYRNRMGLRCPICYQAFLANKELENPEFKSEKELIKHVQTAHGKILCELCLSSLKIFPYEMMCFSKTDYDRHLVNGLTDPSLDYRVDPHPRCRFCRKRFFDEHALTHHLETAHQHCIFCPPEMNAYFQSPAALMEHYLQHHYVCHHPDCEGQAFSVFSTRLELMEHKRLVHNEKETLSLSDLFAGETPLEDETPIISEREIEAAKVFLVEDPSGWSPMEIARRNRELMRELREAFHGDESKLERYQSLCGEFLRGAISAALFYDISINLLGTQNLRVFSHLISLIDDPKRRHVIETLFREARGKKTSQLDREFLRSIGANERQSNSKTLTADSREFLPRVQSAKEISLHSPETPELNSSFGGKSKNGGLGKSNASRLRMDPQGSRTPNDPIESEQPAETPGEQLGHLRQELSQLASRKSRLVERRKVITAENLWNSGDGGLEIIRCVDETLRKKAMREDWEGVDISSLEEIRRQFKEMNERELNQCDWIHHMGIQDQALQNFGLFLECFKGRESLQVPSVPAVNRAKRDLDSIPAKELNRIREIFVLFAREILIRLTDLTKSVDEEDKKRFAAVIIPDKPKEPIFAKAVTKNVKKEPWKTANPRGSSVPEQAKSLFPAMKEVYPTKPPRTINGKPVKIGNSKNQGFFHIEEPKGKGEVETGKPGKPSMVSTLYAPPLGVSSEKSRSVSPEIVSNGKETGWGVKKDPLQEAMENAVREKKKGKGKNKPCILFQY